MGHKKEEEIKLKKPDSQTAFSLAVIDLADLILWTDDSKAKLEENTVDDIINLSAFKEKLEQIRNDLLRQVDVREGAEVKNNAGAWKKTHWA